MPPFLDADSPGSSKRRLQKNDVCRLGDEILGRTNQDEGNIVPELV